MSEEIVIADANMAEIARLRTKINELWKAIVDQEEEIKAERAARQRYDRIVAAARVAVVARDRDSYVKLAAEIAEYDKVTR